MVVPVELRDGMTVLDRYCEGDRAVAAGGRVSGVMAARDAGRDHPRVRLPVALVAPGPHRGRDRRRARQRAPGRGGDGPGLRLAGGGDLLHPERGRTSAASCSTIGWPRRRTGWRCTPSSAASRTRASTAPSRASCGATCFDEEVVPLARALRSMTSLPAEILGLEQRGRLRRGEPSPTSWPSTRSASATCATFEDAVGLQRGRGVPAGERGPQHRRRRATPANGAAAPCGTHRPRTSPAPVAKGPSPQP